MNIKFIIKKSQKVINLKINICSNFQNIKIKICDKMNINPLISKFNFIFPYTLIPINHINTPKQLKLKNNDQIIVDLEVTNKNNYYKDYSNQSKSKLYKIYFNNKTIFNYIGLNLESICVSKICINEGKLIIIPKGKGEFNLNYLLTNTKCLDCPDRDKNTNPPMAIKNFIFVECSWRYTGDYFDSNNFPIRKYSKGWYRNIGGENNKFKQLLSKYKWKELNLIVKGY